MSCRLRREPIEQVCRQVADRLPVLVGITDTAFMEFLRRTARRQPRRNVALLAAAVRVMEAGQAFDGVTAHGAH